MCLLEFCNFTFVTVLIKCMQILVALGLLKVPFPFISGIPLRHSNIIPLLTPSVLNPDGSFHQEMSIYVDKNVEQ